MSTITHSITLHEGCHATVARALGFKILRVSVAAGDSNCDIDTGPDKRA